MAAKEKKPPLFNDPEALEYVTQRVVSKTLGVSGNTVRSLTHKGVIPRANSEAGAARYNLAEVLSAYIAYKTGRRGDKVEHGSRTDLIAEQTRKLKLENAKREGSVIDIEEAQSIFAQFATLLRTGMFSLPGRLAHQLSGHSKPNIIRTIIHEEISDAFRDAQAAFDALLQPVGEDADNDDSGTEDTDASAEENSGPMGGPRKSPAKRKRRARKVEK